MRAFISRAAGGAQLIAALLLVLAAGRYAISALLMAIQETTPGLEDVVSHGGSEPPPATADPAPAETPTASASAVPAGESVRVMLNIGVGPPRSEVFVNGVNRGNSPFLGEVSCKTGAPVRIQVVPAQGAPLEFARKCAPGTITILD